MRKGLFYAGAFLFASVTNAQQKQDSTAVEQLKEVVVTATKIPTEKKNLGKIIYQITPEIIEQNQGKSVVDLINEVPGVEINGNFSTKGQNLGYYIRGGRNRQVAILIDGINVNDPSSFNGDFDLRQIPLNQVETIEILKGAASTLYGTGAATGVINIILKKASENGFNGSFSSYIGSNNSQEEQSNNIDDLSANLNFNGKIGKVDYLFTINALQSKGLSAAESSDNNIKFEEDTFVRYNSLLKIGYNISDNLRLGFFGTFDEFKTDFDGYDFFTNSYVDADNSMKNKQNRFGFTPSYKYNNGELKLNAFYTEIDRDVSPTNDSYKGKAYGFDIYNNYNFSKQISILVGLSAQYQDMYQKTMFSSIEEGSAEQNFYDPYISLNYNSSFGFNLNAGTRLNIHDEYGTHFVYSVNPSYNISTSDKSNLKLLGSFSTAFITPTLQEIFNKKPSIGDLKPEKDFTVEGGLEWSLSGKLNFNAVYFYREETDKIGYDFATFQTINDEGTFLARGVETELNYSPVKKLNLTFYYSYINRDESLLLKIPKNKAGFNIVYQLFENTHLSVNGKYVDSTKDFGDIELSSYKLLDLFISHKMLNDKFTVFTSITNLFNEDYQEIAGFSTRGRNYKFGLQIDF